MGARTLVTFGVCAALAVAALFAFGFFDPGGERTPEPAVADPRRETPTRPDRPQLDAAPSVSKAELAARGGAGAIFGTVRRGEQATAAHVEVVRESGVPEERVAGVGSTTYLRRLFEVPRAPATPTLRAEAGADGRYLFEGLTPGTYRATATAADGAQGSATVVLPVKGARAEANLALVAGGESLSGRVVYADGRAFVGAVFVDGERDLAWEPVSGAPVPLDADGRFVARGLARGQAIVIAIEPGARRVSSAPIPIPYSGEFLLTFDGALSPRSGRVVAADDGSPIAGAIVLGGATFESGGQAIVQTTSGPDGRFEVSWPREGMGGMRALAPGFAPFRFDRSQLPPAPEPIEFRLKRGARLSGRVTAAADGTAVAGVSVRVIPQDRDGRFFTPEPTITGSDGRYEAVDLLAGEAVAFAEGSGWVTRGLAEAVPLSANPFTVMLTAGGTATLDFQVVRAASATGVVLDAAGQPVRGAVVRAQGRQSANRYWYLGAIENVSDGATATAADGTFAMECLVGGAEYYFVATLPDGVQGHSESMTANAEAPLHVEIRVLPLRGLVVSVVDKDTEAPIPGARVNVDSRGGSVILADEGSVETGPDGKAHLAFRSAGPVTLTVYADEHQSVNGVAVAPDDLEPVLRLSRSFAIAGRVRLPDGSPAVGADVEARADEGMPDDPWQFSTSTGETGDFSLGFASKGERTIRARLTHEGRVWIGSAVVMAGGSPVVITLAPSSKAVPLPGTLVVRVVDPDGNPIPSAKAQLEGVGGMEHEVRDGQAEFRPKQREDLWVSVWDAETSDGSPLPLGPVREGPIAATANEMTVRLPREQTIEGVVLGPDGKGVRGLAVTAHWRPPPDASPLHVMWTYVRAFSSETRTGPDGTFRLGRIGAQAYSLNVDVPPEFVPPDTVEARGGAVGVEFRLRSAVAVRVTVVDAAGKPVPRASVRVNRPEVTSSWRTNQVETGANGVARLGGLDVSQRYTLEVDVHDRGDLLSHEQEGWAPADITVRMEAAKVVKGIVRDPAGRPLAGVLIIVMTQERGWFADPTGADGRFTVGQLPPGEVRLSASLEGNFGGDGPEVRVLAGAEDVILTLDPGLELVVKIDDWPLAERGSESATLCSQGGQDRATLNAEVTPEGTARFRGLNAERTYTLWVPPVSDGRSLLQRDVRSSSTPLHVSLVPGKSITGRVTLPAGAAFRAVMASRQDGLLHVAGTAKADGTYEIRGLPPGRWTVQASAKRGEENLEAEVEATAGGTADLDLTPK